MLELKSHRIVWMTLAIFMVQFTNALEYMMVTPLFPLMADALGQDVSQAGYVASSYIFASVIAGLIGFFFLDRLPKKRVIIVCLIMIGLLTSIIPAIKIFSLLLLIRFVTGLFGGILLATAMALLLDLIPEAMRGKMIALVLTAFPLVSIAGLPFILWLAEAWQWQLAFYLLASICFLSVCLILITIPSLKMPEPNSLNVTVRSKFNINPQMVLGAIAPGISNLGTFMFVPLLVPIYQTLLQMPAIEIPWLFCIGGIGALLGTKLAGKWSAPHQIFSLLLLSTGILALGIVYLGWMIPARWFAYSFSFILMFATYLRFTGITILCANIPKASERGGFNALQTAFNHLSASIAFIVPAIWLRDTALNQANFIWLIYGGLGLVLSLLPCIWGLKRYQ